MNDKQTKIEELKETILEHPAILPRGGGTKPALSTPPDGVTSLEMSAMHGVQEYEPAEFTITALAGTPVLEVEGLLSENGQYLPFDPPLTERGATLGGTVAAGLSGPGRYRYGGLRDFLIGVRYMDGDGKIVRGGGKVVKNAAGFDLAKFLVGSMGGFGALVELSFKVFPKPESYATVRLEIDHLDEVLGTMHQLSTSPLDLHAIDFTPNDHGYIMWIRLAGLSSAMEDRIRNLPGENRTGETIQGVAEAEIWRRINEMTWLPEDWSLVRIPVTPKRICDLEVSLKEINSLRHYSAGGQIAWVGTPDKLDSLDEILSAGDLSAQVLFGPPGKARLGKRNAESFEKRIKAALDPTGRFMEV
jgi:glycolate oxidase FAD binding subunit